MIKYLEIKRWLKRIALALLVLILLIIGGAAFVWYRAVSPFYELGTAMTRNDSARKPTIGDLGGIPISIPPGIARFVEYQDDPGFMKPRKGPIPVRTLQSKFRSFGFEMRFPDKALVRDETPEQAKKISPDNTMWVDVGLDIKGYNDALALSRQLKGRATRKWPMMNDGLHSKEELKDRHGYRLLPEPLYGLMVYQVYGYENIKHDIDDRNIYYHVNQKGEVDTYIQCSNVKLLRAPCDHFFVLPHTEHTIAEVNYRIELLPQWQAIQAAATEVILGFAVNPDVQEQNQTPNASSTITGADHASSH
ncbi:MAG: hypothetical protein Q8Q40_05600 [Methylococcaceae bacterium]|nr:hypothetical protein [Methylococcaceae bacterium]MDP3903430.1 hypothetical protein [Methylococcaceae bacterium]